MKDKIKEIIEDVRPDIEYNEDSLLIDEGLLDSFDAVNLVLDLNDEFDIEIGVQDVTPENFNTVDSIEKLVERLRED